MLDFPWYFHFENQTIPREDKAIPQHQLGFQEKLGTIEQAHKIVSEMKSASGLSGCDASRQDAHDGLIFKMKKLHPIQSQGILEYFEIQKLYFEC